VLTESLPSIGYKCHSIFKGWVISLEFYITNTRQVLEHIFNSMLISTDLALLLRLFPHKDTQESDTLENPKLLV
jgi:hypothetical protein